VENSMTSRKRDSKGRFVAASGRKSENSVIEAEPRFGMRTLSALMSRLQLAQMAGLQYEGNRDLYQVFGYQKNIKPEHLLAKYQRQDITSRIVDAPPGATWSEPPFLKEGNVLKQPFEELVKNVKLWNAMYRADRLARLNQFSLLLFGFDDSGLLKREAKRATELLYVRAIGSRQVDGIDINNDPRSPRFGLPEMYSIKFDDPQGKTATGTGTTSSGTKTMEVHASRVVHIAENPLEDLIYATPVVERVYNLLDDLLKVSGGTAETYWLTGNRGMQADVDKEMDIDPADAAALSDEIEEYQHQLRRFIRTRGVKLNVLDSSTPNPTYVFEMIMALISGTTGIPRRILLGSEAGQLASEQDRANWAERIEERRALFATPWILDPTIKLLQNVGLLPEGEAEWEWPSAFIQNPLEAGQTMAQKARAIGNISRQTGNSTPMPFVTRAEAREILGYPEDLTDEEEAELMEFMKGVVSAESEADAEREEARADEPTDITDEENIDERRADETADEGTS